MKTLILAASLALATVIHAQTIPEPIAKVVDKYDALFAQQNAAEEKAGATAKDAYLRDLVKIRDRAKSSGSLDGLVEAEAILKAETEGTAPPPAKVLAADITKARAAYEKAKASAMKLYAPNRKRIEAGFIQEMTALEKAYTRAGQVALAKLTRSLLTKSEPLNGDDVLKEFQGGVRNEDGILEATDGKGLHSSTIFQPPVEITYVINVAGQVRFGYGASQIIFNWEIDNNSLRVDGGPADDQHRPGQGKLSPNEWHTIKQIVTPTEMTIHVDNKKRGTWKADFSRVNQHVQIWPMDGKILLKSVTVKKL